MGRQYSWRLAILAAAVVALLGGGAVAQQVPIGAHYAARGSDVGSVSPTGGYDLSLPIDLPAAKGDLPVPFELRYNASSRVGEGGVGWSIPFSYIVRSDSLTHRRPKHRDVTVVPEAEPRIILVQGGTPTRMVPIGAFTYRPMIGSQGLLLTDLGAGGWELHDGSGRAFRFERLPSLPDESIWVLTLITDRTGPNRVRLSYTVDPVPVAGSEATEVSLSAIRYNFHPSGDCAKHEVKLRYEHPSDAPEILAYVVQNGHVWARTKVLTEIEVLAVDGASCLGVLRRLLGYRLTYRGGADTQMPRLVAVDRIGEAGTPEGEVALPIARYEYGAATSAEQVIGAGAITIPRVLKYKETETVAFPPEVGGLAAGTLGATFISEGGLTEFRTTSTLQDFTGDALPDLVFRNSSAGNAQLWIARNETDFAGTSLGQSAPLFPPALAGVPLSEQWLSGPRYGYESQMNIESTFVQIIDFNGDGRPDVLDARHNTSWTAYLNYPGPNGEPTWVVQTIKTDTIRQALSARGFTDIGSTAPLPLSRSVTGQDLSLRRCLVLHSDGEWRGCPDDPDLPPDEDVFSWADQYTLVEWRLADVNGDGFPDLVASSRGPDLFERKERDDDCANLSDVQDSNGDGVLDITPGTVTFCFRRTTVGFQDPAKEGFKIPVHVDVFYNQAGVEPGNSPAFARPVALQGSQNCALERWADERMTCGLLDVNGDRLLDRVVDGEAYLGTGEAFTVPLTLPGSAVEINNDRQLCDAVGADDSTTYLVSLSAGLLDLTGDGIPDYASRRGMDWKVSIGAGAGFAPAIRVDGAFGLSATEELCDEGSSVSKTRSGLFDVNGDGRPDFLHAHTVDADRGETGGFTVYQLVSGDGRVGAHEAGRITRIGNGYGARTLLEYESAKADSRTSHQVPFPEIVVASERTFAEKGLGASLEPSRYAYGDARLLFDPVWDTWSFPGYRRQVALRGLPAEEEGRIRGTAVITDRLPRPDSSGIDPSVTYMAYSLTGRIADVHFLDGDFSSDPWALLDVDVEADPRWHGNLHREYDTRSNSHHFPIDCTYYLDPYTLSLEITSFYDTTSCNTTGFVFPTQIDAWRGAKAPTVSDANVATRISIESVDEFGRPLRVRHDNDVARDDDDLCEVIAYAESVSGHRILDAVHTWRLRHCVKEPVVFAGVRYRYDDRPEGQVDLGLPTHRIVERYDASAAAGEKLDEFVAEAVSYSAYGDVTRIRRPRDDGVEQTWEMTYDPFRLTPITTTVTASDVQTVLHASTDVDPFSLRPLALHDENGTTWRSYHDGFGREVLKSVQPPDSEQELVLWTADYLGDDGGNPEGRRIRIQKFHSELSKADLEADPAAAGAEAISSIAHFDEFGRQRFREHALGADYDNAILVAEQVTYDGLGRTVFSADPFVLPAQDGSRYGTSLHYRPDDTIRCTIRGRGPQPLDTVTVESEARYPTCYERDYVENQVRHSIFGPNELLPGSPQNGAHSETASTAVGWLVEVSRWRRDERLELSEYEFDFLGQLTTIRRFRQPSMPADPLNWRIDRDSLGQVIRIREPASAEQVRDYNEWGNPTATHWNDAGVAREIRSDFDGFGRVVGSVEFEGGIRKLETESRYAYDVDSGDSDHTLPAFLVGRLSQASGPGMRILFGYDFLGRVAAISHVDDEGGLHAQTYDYGVRGQLDRMSFLLPDAGDQSETVQYFHDSAMRVARVDWIDPSGTETVFEALEIDPLGRYTRVRLGNGTEESFHYKAGDRRELLEHTITTAGGTLNTSFLEHDSDLRIVRRQIDDEIRAPGQRIERYRFDPLYRLANSDTRREGNVVLEFYTYDGLGNLTDQDKLVRVPGGELVVVGDVSVKTHSADRDRICAVERSGVFKAAQTESSASPTGGQWKQRQSAGPGGPNLPPAPEPELVKPTPRPCEYRYDSLGNVVQIAESGLPVRDFAYDGASRIVGMSAGPATASFRYGPFGELTDLEISGTEPADVRRSRRYGPLVEALEIAADGESGDTEALLERRVPGPLGVVMAKRGRGTQARTIYWHNDSTANRLFTDASGAVIQEVEYSPFGAVLTDTGDESSEAYTKYLWNGGAALKPFGVTHLGARLYDPATGRFLQRDPVISSRTASQSHPYAFAFNDPINFIDPLGLDPSDPWTAGGSCTGPEVCGGALPDFMWEWLGGWSDGGPSIPPAQPSPLRQAELGIDRAGESPVPGIVAQIDNAFGFPAFAADLAEKAASATISWSSEERVWFQAAFADPTVPRPYGALPLSDKYIQGFEKRFARLAAIENKVPASVMDIAGSRGFKRAAAFVSGLDLSFNLSAAIENPGPESIADLISSAAGAVGSIPTPWGSVASAFSFGYDAGKLGDETTKIVTGFVSRLLGSNDRDPGFYISDIGLVPFAIQNWSEGDIYLIGALDDHLRYSAGPQARSWWLQQLTQQGRAD